jgi:hypothetical protein
MFGVDAVTGRRRRNVERRLSEWCCRSRRRLFADLDRVVVVARVGSQCRYLSVPGGGNKGHYCRD